MTKSQEIRNLWHEASEYLVVKNRVTVNCEPIQVSITIGLGDTEEENTNACYEVLDFLMCHILEE